MQNMYTKYGENPTSRFQVIAEQTDKPTDTKPEKYSDRRSFV